MPRAPQSRRIARALAVVVTAGAALGLAAPTQAQSSGTDRQEPAKVDREAYYTAPATGAVPATLTNELPPGIVCIVIPQVCGTTLSPVTDPLGNVIGPVKKTPVPDYSGPQSVEPNTLPVSLLGGKPRYTSYLKFALPAIPKGSLVDRFDLVMSETAVSYALESPAFRGAVLAGLATYETKGPDEFVKYLGEVAGTTQPLATIAPTGIELCAVTAPWPAKTSQDAATQPPRDCIFGANGIHDAAAKTWTFDLSLLAQAWLDGSTPNEGVYLGPIGAENLAFGDPDTSTNWQISLGGAASSTPPQLHYAFSEGFGDDASLDDVGGALDLEDSGSSLTPSVDTFGGSALDASIDSSAFTSSPGRSAPSATVAPAAPRRTGAVAGRLVAESRPQSPWWLWLLLPLGLAGTYGFGRSLDQVPPVAGPRRGALTRLMARTDGDAPPST